VGYLKVDCTFQLKEMMLEVSPHPLQVCRRVVLLYVAHTQKVQDRSLDCVGHRPLITMHSALNYAFDGANAVWDEALS
jgi:hypothetical protein